MVQERYELAIGRIKEIEKEELMREPFLSYFRRAASFLVLLDEIKNHADCGELRRLGISELRSYNEKLYEDILAKNYKNSYANPEYMNKLLESDNSANKLSGYLSFLFSELRGLIPYSYENDTEILAIYMELYIEIYGVFVLASEDGLTPDSEEIRQCLYWFERDNLDIITKRRIEEQINPAYDFAYNIIMEENLNDTKYLYYFGEYITDIEIKTAEYINSLPEKDIISMAKTYTEGYRIGFVKTGKDLSKKSSVNIRYVLGFERMIREAIKQFEALGLKVIIYRAGTLSLNKNGQHRVGYYGAIPNKQYDYDHREDAAIYYDKDYTNRRLEVIKKTYEDNKELAYGHAGPAVVEVFGDLPFSPEENKYALTLSKVQKKLQVEFADKAGRLTNEYIKGEERSFTIIAYPTPVIGDNFEEIFRETVRLNTLDYVLYENMQQVIIDELDKAEYIHVKGYNGNETDIKVMLHELMDPEHETDFENCVADVNIPVGEVFTSPKLKGTNGLLHVKQVYLNGLKYINLRIRFEDGVIKDYSCENFDKKSLNKKYIEDNLLCHHETLPLGEFAIGTNTIAYKMARKYNIEHLMPILIGEKTGPHFAIGDTCYSYEEDIMSYNPDGKAIVARSNEFSDLRKTDPKKAYFHCHTDITIPYDELEGIYAVKSFGESTAIIKDGLFVLEGVEELNKPLKNE